MSESSQMTVVGEINEDLLKQFDEQYSDNVNAKAEVRISRLNLLQALSPECAEGKPGYKQGMYINNLSREVISRFGPAPWLIDDGVPANEAPSFHAFPFIPVMKLPTEYIYWRPRKERKEGEMPYFWKTTDINDPRVREGVWPNLNGTWGTKEGQEGAPPVTDNSNYLILPLDSESRVIRDNFLIATFARTSAMAGKNLTTLLDGIKTTRRLRSFQTVFFLYSALKQFGEDKAFVSNVAKTKHTAAEYCKDAYQIAVGMALYLTDTVLGKGRQYGILNAHDPVDDDATDTHGAGGSAGSGDVLDSAASDPFPSNAGEPAF